MKALTIKTEHAEYLPAAWGKEDRIPIRPLGEQVLILTDRAVREERGVVRMTEREAEILDGGAVTGTIIAIGPDAWTYNATGTKPYVGEKPTVGMRVTFTRYAGQVTHLDGKVFRLMPDSAVGGELIK